jgi:serine/threonine protein kinase
LFGLPVASTEGQEGRDPVERLASEFLDRIRKGERPSIGEYVARYPELAHGIHELFPLITAMEDWKSRREIEVVQNELSTAFHIERLGNCRIVRELGRGGMGVVFEGRQEPGNRPVAVKLLPWKSAESSRWRERFEHEARTAAAMKHSHVVPVFEFGEQDGMCFYVMPLVQGIGLDRVIRILRDEQAVSVSRLRTAFVEGQPGVVDYGAPVPAIDASTSETSGNDLTRSGVHDVVSSGGEQRVLRRDAWQQFARIGIQVADALHYAHQQGILHRDIKPGNLLVDDKGSVWITDFGLAMDKDAAALTDSPHMAGTLRYMPPEQFEGQIDERSDIYSLGVTLYELCTLQPAFIGESRQTLIWNIQMSRRSSLRAINPKVPSQLESIILRAMARNPKDRYQSARELAAALTSFHRRYQRSQWRWLKWLRRRFR